MYPATSPVPNSAPRRTAGSLSVAVVLSCLLIALLGAPQAGLAEETFSLKQDTPSTGTMIPRKTLRNSPIPLDKEWRELTTAQQQVVRDEYDGLGANDEPPFPLGGEQTFLRPIAEAYERVGYLMGRGAVLLLVYVSPTGEPTKLEVYKAMEDVKFMNFIATQVMQTRFKPGLCAGKPCEMPYVVTMRFGRS